MLVIWISTHLLIFFCVACIVKTSVDVIMLFVVVVTIHRKPLKLDDISKTEEEPLARPESCI
jgi:hypothetical protein